MNVRLYECPLIRATAYTNVRLYECPFIRMSAPPKMFVFTRTLKLFGGETCVAEMPQASNIQAVFPLAKFVGKTISSFELRLCHPCLHWLPWVAWLLPPVYTNSQNWIRLHKIGGRDRKISIFLSNFVQSDLIWAVRVNGGWQKLKWSNLCHFAQGGQGKCGWHNHVKIVLTCSPTNTASVYEPLLTLLKCPQQQ